MQIIVFSVINVYGNMYGEHLRKDDIVIFDKIDEILPLVEKPARYTGNELNMEVKDPKTVDIRFAYGFPDLYEVAMSHLGTRIMYHLINKRDDTYCERFFAPWHDMESQLRGNNIKLFSLETKSPLDEFDVIGFTLQYEMSYTNILNMLDLGGVPVLSKERTNVHPFVCAGGPCAYNPEPLADICDFFVLGEGEEVINDLLDVYSEWKKSGEDRIEFLRSACNIEGIYVPSLYDVEYNPDDTIKGINPIYEDVPKVIKKRIVKDLDNAFYPDKLIVPYVDVVHDRAMLELFRGCTRGCRFCQAGFVYRPVREKSHKKLLEQANNMLSNTGYEEISLVSLSTSDYSEFEELSSSLLESTKDMRVNLSLPSLRLDSFSLDLMEKAQKVRKSGLTFASEAGTQRLRDVINKGINEEDLMSAAKLAFEGGWHSIKLYFMLGLPTETMEDVEGIAKLAKNVVNLYFSIKNKGKKKLNITVSTSFFIPKPLTPFQWEAQDDIESYKKKCEYLRDLLKSRFITYNWHDYKVSYLEAVFARGDRKCGRVLYNAWKKGCKFDSWNEHFKSNLWNQAFIDEKINPDFYAKRERNNDEILPWDHIDVGVSKSFLVRERKKAYKAEKTVNCRDGCSGCGASIFQINDCCR